MDDYNITDFFKRIAKVSARIDKMITLCDNANLTIALIKLKNDLTYCSPEMVGSWAMKMNDVLVQYIGDNPQPGWQTAVIDAYTK